MKKLLSIILAVLMIATTIPFAFAADDYAVVDTEAGTVTIDGTLGGKTTATEDDVNALVEKLKGYVDSGITTIIVTGSEPALHNFYGIDTSAVSAALYYLADNNLDSPYCGTIDLILPDVTEIVDDEFNNTFSLNSITLPKVTTVGDGAFYAAIYLQTITFGSLVTSITQKNRVVFHMVGYNVGGCALVLNCGQANEDSPYIPDFTANTWYDDNNKYFKSITFGTHVSSGWNNACDCGASVAAEVEHSDTTTYYATLADALAAAQVLTDPYGMQANVYALADCDDDFTVPASVDFNGRSYSFGGNVTNNGYIWEGTFTGNVTNNGSIREGTFTGNVTNEDFIHGGTFNDVINHDIIDGGTFNGNVTNYDRIYNDFDEDKFTLGDDFTIENNGDIYCEYHFWKNGQCRLCAYVCTHTGGEATCTAKAVCETCGGEYGDIDKDNHDGKTVTVEAKAKTCTDIGWEAYEYCTACDYTTYVEIPASHEIVKVDAQAKTCTDIGWEAYEYCEACDYTTYVEIPASHEIKTVEAKAKTCTSVGWEAYEYCTACDYTTYKEIPASHEIVTVDKKDATCTGVGHEAYEYCTDCDYTTYKEIPSNGHTEEAVKGYDASCSETGLTDGVKCSVCGKTLTAQTEIVAKGHKDTDGNGFCDNDCGTQISGGGDGGTGEPEPDEPTDDTCDHLCHSNNWFIENIIWKIARFFQKLFGIQQYCDCGVTHW